MTKKEQFLINAQVYYYNMEIKDKETFLLMDNNVKEAALEYALDDTGVLEDYEIDYLVDNNEKLLIRYFEELIDNGVELTETEFARLTFTQMGIWVNMLHKAYKEDEAEDEWRNHWVSDLYTTLRASHRDNQINSILND
jgi:hypothetical protein